MYYLNLFKRDVYVPSTSWDTMETSYEMITNYLENEGVPMGDTLSKEIIVKTLKERFNITISDDDILVDYELGSFEIMENGDCEQDEHGIFKVEYMFKVLSYPLEKEEDLSNLK